MPVTMAGFWLKRPLVLEKLDRSISLSKSQYEFSNAALRRAISLYALCRNPGVIVGITGPLNEI